MSAKFITFEGGEGAGKTTQIQLVLQWLQERKIHAIATREPGGNREAEVIRSLLLDSKQYSFLPKTQLALFLASRIEHVEKTIKPALKAGTWVLCDRFLDSTKVYQGIAQKMGVDVVEKLHALLLEDFTPNITFVMDIPVKEGLKRIKSRDSHQDPYENMQETFHRSVRQGFLTVFQKGKNAHNKKQRFYKIDGLQDKSTIQKSIRCILKQFTEKSV